ncbi:50S ribosomal protein L29 [Candidatus Pacearchaeota archaeon]|nr:50S ribosomal protein L29 [Candidatus Pacearchaeota archaeon]
MKDVKSLSAEEQKKKIKELRLELIKANVTANKTNAKTKELKRALARLLTVSKTEKITPADKAGVKKA